MNYHHLYTDEYGESHWRDVEVHLDERTFAPPAQRILISESDAAKAFVFFRLPVGWDEPIDPTPIA